MTENAKDYGDWLLATERVRDEIAKIHASIPRARLPMWVVFGPGTTDHPGLFLARLRLTLPQDRATSALLRAGTLEEIRDLLPEGLARIPRQDGDDPNIIEVWL